MKTVRWIVVLATMVVAAIIPHPLVTGGSTPPPPPPAGIGPVDAFIDMGGNAVGTQITPSVMSAGTIGGSGISWTTSGVMAGMTVGPSHISLPSSVTVGAVTYTPSHSTQSIAYDNANSYTYLTAVIPGDHTAMTMSGYVTIGPAPSASGNNIDLAVIYSLPGYFASMQLNNSQYSPGGDVIRIESDGAGIIHSSDITVTPGVTYWYSLKADFGTGQSYLNLYDTNGNLVGSVTLPVVVGSTVAKFYFGNAQTGTSPGQTTYFEDMLLDYTNAAFPLGPGTPQVTPPPPSAPSITSATSATGRAGSAFTYQTTATNSPTSYGATGLPAGLGVNTGTGLISGTPTSAGTSTVTLSATNSGGTGTATLTLTINIAPPVITSATSASGTAGSAFSYQITATNSPTSYAAGGLPAGLVVNTGTGLISGTPTSAGTSTVTLSATNSGGTGTATLTLTINIAPPAITSATSGSGTVGSAFSYQITATNSPTSYGASGLPAGLTINSRTGLISGTPAAAGTSAVILSATNSGGMGTVTLILIIAPALPPGSTISFNVPNLGATSMIFCSTSGSIAAGYSNIQFNAGSPTPSGVLIFGLRETSVLGPSNSGVLVAEAGVPATPLIQTGRLYVEVNGTMDTGLAVANPGLQDAVVSFSFTDTTGRTFGSGSTTIPAGQQIARFLDQTPFNGGNSIQGTFTFSSSVPVAVIALQTYFNERGDFLITTLPVVDLSASVGSSVVLLPHFADGGGWVTSVVLVNPTDNPINGSVQFLNPSGSLQTLTAGGQTGNTFSYAIPGRSSFKLVSSGAGTTTGSGSVHVKPAANTGAPIGLVLFSYKPAGITVTDAGVSSISGTAFRMYAEGSGVAGAAGSIQTGVAIANADASPGTVNLELFNRDGTSAGATSLTIPGNGQVAALLNSLFPNLPQPFQGVLRIATSSSGLAVVGLRTRYNERGDFLITTTPPASESAQSPGGQLFFTHLAVGGGYCTQLILFSGSPGPSSSGTLNFVSPSGLPWSITP